MVLYSSSHSCTYEGERKVDDLDDLEMLEMAIRALTPQETWLEKARKWAEFAVVAGLLLTAVVAAFGIPVMLLWNTVVTDVFGLKHIGYLESCGLFLLARILFTTTSKNKKS